ncbi:hypothetical protein D9V32_14055 [Mycetocola tolaasinivorans]|uniref:Uncharacterized protein n=1 Tax=Mycetocola tolaasinivorans TaxID=76635 RepID=A0A3L7A0X5_9MICO|nr:hypothetical protein [Mycetocola tolaasinivorans]RLP73650.1 hypothetical protein D9V32_14055 [Mycetocola tolaasinivorans]
MAITVKAAHAAVRKVVKIETSAVVEQLMREGYAVSVEDLAALAEIVASAQVSVSWSGVGE